MNLELSYFEDYKNLLRQVNKESIQAALAALWILRIFQYLLLVNKLNNKLKIISGKYKSRVINIPANQFLDHQKHISARHFSV